ncbi:MAG: antitoxin [Candidatus Omnitrophica bacterium]|nr:antitoxin [Candidatus Omnitrophota bacterium]MDD5736982.1 antitoxin [Candidatus Omnitrophota bacterium]
MKSVKVTSEKKRIEKNLLKGDYKPVSDSEFRAISESIARRKKDAVLNIRVNSQDLEFIKQKARKLGIKYQTFISEVIHKIAL